MQQEFPELGEFVVVTVKKVMPYGAFCSLDEYSGREAFVHISEVSSGWIRNIREYVKEGSKLVAKVINVDREKNQVDLSLKRASETDKKRKLKSYQNEKRAQKLLERTALKLNKNFQQAMSEVGSILLKDYGELYAALEAISSKEFKSKIPKKWETALEEVVKQEIKPKKVEVRMVLKLQCFKGNGVEVIKEILGEIEKTSSKKVGVKVHYLGAPNYFVDATAGDYKTAEKALNQLQEATQELAKKLGAEASFEKTK